MFDKDGIFCAAVREELCKHNNVWINLSCFTHEIFADLKGSSMAVVQPKSIEALGHELHVFLKVSPKKRRIFLLVTKTQLD